MYDNINKLLFWILTRKIIQLMQNLGFEEITDAKPLLQSFYFLLFCKGDFVKDLIFSLFCLHVYLCLPG